MGYSIAVAGKGGTGKTSITGLLIRYLTERRKGPILAVDADANANLNDVLGVKFGETVGHLREDTLIKANTNGGRPGGLSLEEYLDLRIQQVIVEAKGFDLLVMGRPEGPGCYCAANTIIRKYVDRLADSYPYIVMDNEAGLEHLSRRTTQDVDLMLIISDPTIRGIDTVKRILVIVEELKLRVDRSFLIVNRVTEETAEILKRVINKEGLALAGMVPQDQLITEYDLLGKPLFELPQDSKAVKTVFDIADSLEIP